MKLIVANCRCIVCLPRVSLPKKNKKQNYPTSFLDPEVESIVRVLVHYRIRISIRSRASACAPHKSRIYFPVPLVRLQIFSRLIFEARTTTKTNEITTTTKNRTDTRTQTFQLSSCLVGFILVVPTTQYMKFESIG